jgi:6-phosphogluconate dehydrogenase
MPTSAAFAIIGLGKMGGTQRSRHRASCCYIASWRAATPRRWRGSSRCCGSWRSTAAGYMLGPRAAATSSSWSVHNGVEFGMLQAIGEGVDLLQRFRHKLPVAEVLEC